MRLFICGAAILAISLTAGALAQPESFRFVIIGDRTGETEPGIYERVLKQAAAEHPAFAVTTGDTIQGLNDDTAEAEWQQARRAWPAAFAVYLAPGNHDIWSHRSEELFRKYSGHDLHYSFDYGQVHVAILDNSRADQLSQEEMTFLDEDLNKHKSQQLKFIVSHRPSWIVNAVIGDTKFPLQQVANKYGAQFVIAGHIHQMLHAQVGGVEYISMPSAGGHLRASGKYEDGWFFGYAVVDVKASDAAFQIRDLAGQQTQLKDWGPAGLIR